MNKLKEFREKNSITLNNMVAVARDYFGPGEGLSMGTLNLIESSDGSVTPKTYGKILASLSILTDSKVYARDIWPDMALGLLVESERAKEGFLAVSTRYRPQTKDKKPVQTKE